MFLILSPLQIKALLPLIKGVFLKWCGGPWPAQQCQEPRSPDKQALVTVLGQERTEMSVVASGVSLIISVRGDDEVWGKEKKGLNSHKTPRIPGLRAIGNRPSFNYFEALGIFTSMFFFLSPHGRCIAIIDWLIYWLTELVLAYIYWACTIDQEWHFTFNITFKSHTHQGQDSVYPNWQMRNLRLGERKQPGPPGYQLEV